MEPIHITSEKLRASAILAVARGRESEAREYESMAIALDAKDARIRELTTLAEKVDAIRNTIVGAQNVSFSRDIYPLVAALGDAGYPGEGYEKASARIHGYVEEIKKLEAALAAAKARCERLEAAIVAALDNIGGDGRIRLSDTRALDVVLVAGHALGCSSRSFSVADDGSRRRLSCNCLASAALADGTEEGS